MADILPKIKLYLFMTAMLVLINMGVFVSKQTTDVLTMIASIGTSFIPFAGLVTLLVFPSGLPVEFLAFAGLIIGVFSGITAYMLGNIIANYIPFVDV